MRNIIEKGLTLVELLITILMLTILAGVIVFIFRAVLLNWQSQENRAGIGINLDSALEEMARDIREAKTVSSANDEIRFSQNDATFYVYYLYNQNDSYPPSFNQSAYELRKATLSGGIGGTFTYGAGALIVTDVLPPPTSDMSFSSNLVTLDLSISAGGETIRSRSKIKPRNL